MKKRAVFDLLKGMRKQGILHAKSNTPTHTSDMLRVMALAQPFAQHGLAGSNVAWLFRGGDGNCTVGKGSGDHGVAADILKKGERYFIRGVSELSRLRLESGAPVSRDITRKEAEVSF